MAAAEEIRKLKDATTGAKAEMDKLLGSADALERKAIKATKAYKDQVIILKEGNEQIKEKLNLENQAIDSLIQQEGKLKGLTGLQASLVDQDRQRIALQDKIDSSYGDTHDSLNSIASLNQDLLSMSAEDVLGREKIKNSINDQLSDLIGMEGVTDEIVQNLKSQFQTSSKISDLTEGEQKALNQQISAYEGIKDTIDGVLDTAAALTKTTGGIVGSLIIGFGKIAGVVGKTTREMGGFIGGLTGATAQVSLLGTIFPQALDSAKGLSSEFGGLSDLSFQTQLNTNLMATNMGIGGAEAAALTGNFARLNGGSIETAQNLAESTKQLALANGLMPSQVMQDVAGSAKAFAEYGKDGGKNIGIAAVAAGKLGVNMATMTGVTDSLLDFESSITKELELGAMLGKNINLGKARQLAYEGKIGASVKEALKQMGGIESFNKMDIYQKRAAAAALGVSTEELQKMATNMDKLNDDGTMQLSTFESLNQTMKALASGPAATFLQTLGSGVIAIGQMGEGFKTLGPMMGKLSEIKTDVFSGAKKLGGGVVKGVKRVGTAAVDLASAAAKGILNIVRGKEVVLTNASTVSTKRNMGSRIAQMAIEIKDRAVRVAGNAAKIVSNGIDYVTQGLQKTWLGQKALMIGAYVAEKVAIVAGTVAKWLGIGATVAAGAANTTMAASNTAVGATSTVAAGGIAAVAAAALAGAAGLGVLALFALAIGAALYLAAPALEAVASIISAIGGIIIGVMGAIPPIIGAIAAGMVSILGAITIKKAIAVAILGASFIGLAAGLFALSIASLFAGPALIGLSVFMFALGAGAMMLGQGIELASQGFSTLLPVLGSFMSSITLEQIGLIGLFSATLLGLGTSLLYLGIVGGMGAAVLIGVGAAMMFIGKGSQMMGEGFKSTGMGLSSIMTSLGGMVEMIGPIGMLSLALLGLSGALLGLGLAMAFLGFAGLPGMLMLAGIAAISAPIIKLAGLFGVGGGGDSETSSLEKGSLSEYETNMLAKMDQLIQATSSQRDIYLDKDKVTKTVMNRSERNSVNKLSMNYT